MANKTVKNTGKPSSQKTKTLPAITVTAKKKVTTAKPNNMTYLVKTGELRDPNSKWKSVSQNDFNTKYSNLPRGARQSYKSDSQELLNIKKRGLI